MTAYRLKGKRNMGKLRILSKLGDTTVQWDTKAGAEEAVREAKRIFKQELSSGSTAFRVSDAAPAERITCFDPQAEQIVIVPRVAGG
ncbi:MAG: hypothetical protein M3506_08970 [Chloroflexota bacterium]|nr:hypothetical protein [Chloroflexota bacterium]